VYSVCCFVTKYMRLCTAIGTRELPPVQRILKVRWLAYK